MLICQVFESGELYGIDNEEKITMNNQKIIGLAQEIIYEASQSEENAISNFQIEVTESQII